MNELMTSNKVDELMEKVANGDINEDVSRSLVDKNITLNQVKVFQLAQAKKELQRVIKLTRMLEKVENAYGDKLDEVLESGHLGLADYGNIIGSINGMLSRSDKIISSVLKDDSLSNLVLIDNSTNIQNNTNGVMNANLGKGLTDPDSRDRVMKAVNNIVNVINTATAFEQPDENDGLDNPEIQSDLGEIYMEYSEEDGDTDEQ